MINKKQAQEVKKAILCKLTADKDKNMAIFDLKEGYACFNGTNLEMVMDKVVEGIWSCIDKGCVNTQEGNK